MPTPDVVNSVRALKQQLENAKTFPNYTVITQHVDSALAEPEHAPHYHSLRDRLAESSVDAEVEHPDVVSAIRGVIASLQNAGI